MPNKALIDLGGKPCVERCIDAVLASKYISQVIFATSDEAKDDELAESVMALNKVSVYRGHGSDPAKRMFEASKHLNPKHIIRVTGIRRFFYLLVRRIDSKHLSDKNDYSRFSNAPLGLASEIFTTVYCVLFSIILAQME